MLGGRRHKSRHHKHRKHRNKRSDLSKAGSLFGTVAIYQSLIGGGFFMLVCIGVLVYANFYYKEPQEKPPNPNDPYNLNVPSENIKSKLNWIFGSLLVLTIIITFFTYKYRNNNIMKGFAGVQMVTNILRPGQ